MIVTKTALAVVGLAASVVTLSCRRSTVEAGAPGSAAPVASALAPPAASASAPPATNVLPGDAATTSLKIAMLPLPDAGATPDHELGCIPCELWLRCTGACFLRRGLKGGPAFEQTQKTLIDKCYESCRTKSRPKLSKKERADVIRCITQPDCEGFAHCMYGDKLSVCPETPKDDPGVTE